MVHSTTGGAHVQKRDSQHGPGPVGPAGALPQPVLQHLPVGDLSTLLRDGDWWIFWYSLQPSGLCVQYRYLPIWIFRWFSGTVPVIKYPWFFVPTFLTSIYINDLLISLIFFQYVGTVGTSYLPTYLFWCLGWFRIPIKVFQVMATLIRARVSDPDHFRPDPDPAKQNLKNRILILLALT